MKKLLFGKDTKTAAGAPVLRAETPGMITRTCRYCGKTFTLPENVQHWPDACQECRAKLLPEELITRVCRRCGKSFTFPSSAPRWPRICDECRNRKEKR
jgi:hypothetical protein